MPTINTFYSILPLVLIVRPRLELPGEDRLGGHLITQCQRLLASGRAQNVSLSAERVACVMTIRGRGRYDDTGVQLHGGVRSAS